MARKAEAPRRSPDGAAGGGDGAGGVGAGGGRRRRRAAAADGGGQAEHREDRPRGRARAAGGRDGRGAGYARGGRRAAHAAEVAEIERLELRIAAEGPPRGQGGGFEAAAAGEGAAPSGPALTGKVFTDLPLSTKTLNGLASSSFVRMTEIQRGAIPHALCGRDVLGEARTGSGKTLAFLVPLVELLYRRRWTPMDGLGAVVVSPTRELAYQIFQVLTGVGSDHDLSAGCIVGGRSLEGEQQTVTKMNILIATPGRLLQHLDESPGFDAARLLALVLDEADRILDFGFQETVHNILAHLPQERQTLLFSATLRASVQRLGRAALKRPEIVSVHKEATSRTPDKLKQVYMTVSLENKVDVLFSFLRSHSQKKIIVFVSSCKQVRFFYEAFRRLKPGPAVMELHGRQNLTKRMYVFGEFTERDHAVALFCTDIAARGVDFPAVDWVVQLDCPDSVDSYIHRVGRTARYESSGHSVLFLLPSEGAFAEKLRNARVVVQNISAKQGKVFSIQQKLAAAVAGDSAVRYLAQKALASYVRSVRLMKDKEVFNGEALVLTPFAASLGLADAPALGDLTEQANFDKNPLKRRKNQTALQRLKEKIRQKKEAAAGRGESAAPAAPDGRHASNAAAGEDAKDDELEQPPAKKLGRWERRQRRIARLAAPLPAAAPVAAAPPAASSAASAFGGAPPAEEDELLQLVDASRGPIAAPIRAQKRRRLKIRRDGRAADAGGAHTYFSGDGARAANALAHVAEELQGDDFEEASGQSSGDRADARAGFLSRVAQDLAERDASDAAQSRARLHERHQKRRRREREERGGGGEDDDGGAPVLLGRASSPSPSPPPRAPTPSRGRAAPRAAPAAAAEAPAPGQRKRRGGEASAPPPPGAPGGGGVGDALGALEREALGRLGTGLFS